MADPLAVPRDPDAAEEDAFVAAAVRAIALQAWRDVPAPPSGECWIDRARLHGILLPVIGALRAAGHDVPPELIHHRTVSALSALRAKQDLFDCAVALDDACVDWVVLKGPVLNETVYQRTGTRESADLDLVVPPAELRRAWEVLAGRGVRRLGVDWSQRTWAHGAEVPLVATSGTVVDLHWHVLNRPQMRRAYALSIEDMLARRKVRVLSGLRVSSLDDLDFVLHVLLHACLDGCGRWRALLDAQQCVLWLASQGWEPGDLAGRAGSARLQAPSWVVLSMAADHLDASLTPWRDAMASPTLWSRTIHGLSRRPGGSPLHNGLTRRLVRYTAPTSAASVLGVAGYVVSRLVRVFSPDRTEVLPHAPADDPQFDLFLDKVRARAGTAGS